MLTEQFGSTYQTKIEIIFETINEPCKKLLQGTVHQLNTSDRVSIATKYVIILSVYHNN